ncbi:hypothetical protein Vafri_86 [Volvox africanus]|nr:hypothetical protein Vafri_86 [Volvox africanus]
MALTMDAGSLRELSSPSPARQDSAPGAPPFSNSRLRGYAGRMEGMLDSKVILSSSIALTAMGIVDPFPPVAGSPRTQAPMPAGFSHPEHAGPGEARGEVQPLPSQSQQQQHVGHHARFAPVPAVLSPPGSAGPSPAASAGQYTSSRFVPRGAEQQLPPAATAAANPGDLAVALSQIQALKAEIAGVETVLGYLKGSETSTTTLGRKAHKLPSQEQLRARADALAASRATSRAGGGSPHSAAPTTSSVDSTLLSPLRGSVGHSSSTPARAKSAGDTPAGRGAASATGVFETLAAETKLGRTWRVPRGPQPVGRGEAVILEAALDEALPPGAISAKYGSGAAVELSFWSGGDVRQDFEMLEMVQREVARQVGVSCVERGRIIEKLADRHSEIFVAVVAAANAAAEAQRSLTDELTSVRARALEQASEIALLRSELAARGAEAEDLREQLSEATTSHEHYVWDTEQELEQLQGQADILAAEVEHLHVRLSEAVVEKDAALSRGLERLEGDLAAVTDERDDLAQRIRFLERHLHKLRTEMNTTVDTESVEVQTDPIDWGPVEEEDLSDDCSDTPSLAEIRARYAAQGYGALTPEERIRLGLPPNMGSETNKEHKGRKRKRALGHFEGLISSEKPGRVRGLPWTMNAISAIYYDKMLADAVSDREGNPRQRLADFAVDWHMTRFGLRNLAELHLLDLIGSVRQHYKTSVRIRWFGQFTGLVEVGDSVDTTTHVSFYLTVLSNLAAPNSIVSLFPDTGGEEGGGTPPVAIKAAALPEATRAVFRYLGEPEGAVPFLARAVDPITDPDTQLAPLDPLVALFMAEYQKRWERNAAHLRALFRAGDYDDDGLIGYDEFASIVRQLVPEGADRVATKMYSDAMRRLPKGQSLVDPDTFLAVARAFGWDRWRVDMGAVATITSGGGGGPKPNPATWSLVSASQHRPPSASTSVSSVPPGVTAAAAAAITNASVTRPNSGAVTRSENAMARTVLGAATGTASMRAAPATAPPAMAPLSSSSVQPYNRPTATVSNLRREDSVVGLSDADRALLRVLDGALEGLDPPLEEQVAALLDKLRGTVAAAQQQAATAAAAAATVPGLELLPSTKDLTAAIAADNMLLSKLEGQFAHFCIVYGERTDPAAAWLAFRLLMASLAAATAGSRARPSRSRPGSAKGTVGWGVPRTAMRLTVPALPFRAGNSSRAILSGGVGATSRNTPNSSLGFGQGLGPTGSLQQILSGVSGSSTVPGSAGGEGSMASGIGLAMTQTPPSPLSRSTSRSPPVRSPDLPGRPVGLAQIIQGGSAAGSFADRQASTTLVIPSPTAAVPLHRMPLPTTLSNRGPALSASINTPTKRGVVFSLGNHAPPIPPAGGATASGGSTPGGAPSAAPLEPALDGAAAAAAAVVAATSSAATAPEQERGQETVQTAQALSGTGHLGGGNMEAEREDSAQADTGVAAPQPLME